MHSSIENLVDDLHQKEKEIEYLKELYKEKTGEELIIPNEESDQNYIEQIQEEGNIPNQRFHLFKDKVNSLNLPSASDKDAKNRIEKLRRKKDTTILIQALDLSYFAGKDITVELLKKVIEGLKILKSVTYINLSHNDLTDNLIDIISEFFQIPNLNKIDLSYNKFTQVSVKKLINVIKNCKKLEFLDVSYNPFNSDESCCLSICSAIKGCDKLMHFGINDSSRDAALKLLACRPLIKSMNLEDSRYKKKTFEILYKYLINKKFELCVLSLKYCKIDFLYAAQYLANGLQKNYNLTGLNLYSTSLSDISGKIIIRSIRNHKNLRELDVGGNFLSIESCKAIGELLRVNRIINVINITKNMLIVNESFFYILQGLVENNTIKSLGDLINTKIGVKYRESALKILSLNSKVGNWCETQILRNQKMDFYDDNVRADEFDIQAKESLREIKRLEQSMDLQNRFLTKRSKRISNIIDKEDNDGYMESNNFQRTDYNKSNNADLKDLNKNYNFIHINSNISNYNDAFTDTINETKNLKEISNKNLIQSQKLREIMEYKKDINTIIQPLNPNKKDYNVFISYQNLTKENTDGDEQLSSKNRNKKHKVSVPYSIPGTNFLKESLEIMKQRKENKKKAKTVVEKKSNSKDKKSTSKGKKKVTIVDDSKDKAQKYSILNVVASYVQEIIDTYPEITKDENKDEVSSKSLAKTELIQFKNNVPYKTKEENIKEKENSQLKAESGNMYSINEDVLMDLNDKYGILDLKDEDSEEEQSLFNTYVV